MITKSVNSGVAGATTTQLDNGSNNDSVTIISNDTWSTLEKMIHSAKAGELEGKAALALGAVEW